MRYKCCALRSDGEQNGRGRRTNEDDARGGGGLACANCAWSCRMQRIGRLGSADLARLNVALAFVMGLAD